MIYENCVIQKINLVKGEDKEIFVIIENEETQEPLDISTASEIKAIFQGASNTLITRKLSLAEIVIVSGIGGKFKIKLTETNTASFRAGNDLDFETEIQIGTNTYIIQFLKSLTVKERIS